MSEFHWIRILGSLDFHVLHAFFTIKEDDVTKMFIMLSKHFMFCIFTMEDDVTKMFLMLSKDFVLYFSLWRIYLYTKAANHKEV